MKKHHSPFISAIILILLSCFYSQAKEATKKNLESRVGLSSFGNIKLTQSLEHTFAKIRLSYMTKRPAGNELTPSSAITSYIYLIPFVTKENNYRTNLGLNNNCENSFVNGLNPSANILIGLFDQQGTLAGTGFYTVQTNQMLQLNDVITSLQGNIDTGWLILFSDEPISAWASVISNSTNDPSIEQAIPMQIVKPSAYVENLADGYFGTRLLIPSSTKTGSYQSSLVVVNIGMDAGPFTIKIYNNSGQLIDSKYISISSNGLYVNNDIRSSASGTYGQIVIEPNSDTLILAANSNVVSSSGNGAFFPAVTLPPPERKSMAGIWEGSLTGDSTDAQVKVMLFQEGSILYGFIDKVSGSFPTQLNSFLIHGMIRTSGLADLQIEEVVDTDSAQSWISFRFIGGINTAGTAWTGISLYADEQNRHSCGSFTLNWTGHIF
jgi:hypothetical protein